MNLFLRVPLAVCINKWKRVPVDLAQNWFWYKTISLKSSQMELEKQIEELELKYLNKYYFF